jgi:hypothetical protein
MTREYNDPPKWLNFELSIGQKLELERIKRSIPQMTRDKLEGMVLEAVQQSFTYQTILNGFLKKEINCQDSIVQSVIDKYRVRSSLGVEKYGTTLAENEGDLFEWLNHLQEELMDATLYLERLKNEKI